MLVEDGGDFGFDVLLQKLVDQSHYFWIGSIFLPGGRRGRQFEHTGRTVPEADMRDDRLGPYESDV